jgi:hypothetical protein
MSEVFSKTGKGQEEIKARTGNLSQRVRQVLIFIDGKRDLDALRAMLPAGDLENTLQMLQEQDYIGAIETAGIGISELAPTAASEETPISDSTAFRELPPTSGTPDLELARNFMMNTLKSFIGPYAALSLLEKVDAAQSHAEMRAHFEPWMEAIIETHDGKRRADELRCALLKII